MDTQGPYKLTAPAIVHASITTSPGEDSIPGLLFRLGWRCSIVVSRGEPDLFAVVTEDWIAERIDAHYSGDLHGRADFDDCGTGLTENQFWEAIHVAGPSK